MPSLPLDVGKEAYSLGHCRQPRHSPERRDAENEAHGGSGKSRAKRVKGQPANMNLG